jgi:putative ABC transport system ATP-binding protein
MDSIVTATDVRRRYGEGAAAVDALAGVSVEFERGRYSAIMGPSGSGKSTLMHILAGLDRPTSGSVVLDGVDITALDDGDLTRLRRDKLGFIFQFFNLLPVLTASGRTPSGCGGSWTRSGCPTGSRTARPSCRAASSSAWRWPGR